MMYQAGLVLEGGAMKGVYTAGVLDFFSGCRNRLCQMLRRFGGSVLPVQLSFQTKRQTVQRFYRLS